MVLESDGDTNADMKNSQRVISIIIIIPGRVITKTQKMVLDVTLLNTQHYKLMIKGKVEGPPLHLSVVAIEKRAFGSPSTKVADYTFLPT